MALIDVVFKIPEEHLPYYIQGTARDFGYSEIGIDGEPNPESKAVFAKRKTAAEMRRRAIRGMLAIARDEIEIPEIDVTP